MSEKRKDQNDKKRFHKSFEECRGTKNISCIKAMIPKVKDDKGETITSRREIEHVFGEIYSKLDESTETEEKLQNTLSQETRADDDEKTKIRVTMKKHF